MNWFSRLFATRRELKRLVKSEQFWRDRANALEVERDRLLKMLLATNGVWADRVLTAAGRYPISQEVKQIVEDTPEQKQLEYQKELNEFLLTRKLELEEDARDAGLPIAKAAEKYQQEEPFLKEQFREAFGFNN